MGLMHGCLGMILRGRWGGMTAEDGVGREFSNILIFITNSSTIDTQLLELENEIRFQGPPPSPPHIIVDKGITYSEL